LALRLRLKFREIDRPLNFGMHLLFFFFIQLFSEL
jgi:hypothetical protein